MSMYDDFLLEIGCEELPARMQSVLIQALEKNVQSALADEMCQHPLPNLRVAI